MNKSILLSLAIIGVVGAVATGATVSYFSDTETSSGNTISAGVIDIVVDDENPWNKTYSETLYDMKPCMTKYIEFTVRNSVYSNPINLWKHIHITDQTDGYITEPECEEGGGTWTAGATQCHEQGSCCTGNYVPRNNLASYIIYDMWVCADPDDPAGANPIRCLTDTETGEPLYDTGWEPIIEETQYVRLDNVSSAWIYLGQLHPAKELKVVQSYHLMSWPGAPEPEVTNWAQGDELTFDIDIMGTQLNGPGPKGYQAQLVLDNKDANWSPINDNIKANMTYKTSGSLFDYSLSGTVKNANTEYCLIYYADPYPGDGKTNSTGALIGKADSDGSGNISIANTQVELGTDLPNSDDTNYPGGAKVWLVPCADYSASTAGQQGKMTAWNPSEYLFEMQFITYDDIDV